MTKQLKSEDSAFIKFGQLLLFLASAAFLYFGYIRTVNGMIPAFDTGLYQQILENLRQGRGWASSLTVEPNFLGHHFQPIVAVLVPWYSVVSSAFGLLLVDWIFIAGSCALLIYVMPRFDIVTRRTGMLTALAFCFYPTIANRLYYSFVPEVMALPFLIMAAIYLAKKETLTRRDKITLFVCLMIANLTKETIWITSAFVYFILSFKYRKTKDVALYAACSALFAAAFVYLFIFWMPAHSNQSHYYAMSYYSNAWVDGRWGFAGKILGGILNAFSYQNMVTFGIVVFFLPLGLLFVGNHWVTAAALPAIGIIMAASDSKVHSLTNQYLIAALPFIFISSAIGLEKMILKVNKDKFRQYACLLFVLMPCGMMIAGNSGLASQYIYVSPYIAPGLEEAVAELKNTLKSEDVILVDGTLQPFFAEYPNVKVLLGFEGNPTRIKAEDLLVTTHVITRSDLTEVEDCRSVKPGPGDALVFDYEGFYLYCEWLKKIRIDKKVILPKRLIDLRVIRD